MTTLNDFVLPVAPQVICFSMTIFTPSCIAVVAWLFALGGAVARFRKAANGSQRIARWLLLSVSVGFGLYAVDEWQFATQQPPTATVHHTAFWWVGAVFVFVPVFIVMWRSLRANTDDGDSNNTSDHDAA